MESGVVVVDKSFEFMKRSQRQASQVSQIASQAYAAADSLCQKEFRHTCTHTNNIHTDDRPNNCIHRPHANPLKMYTPTDISIHSASIIH